MHAPTSAPRYRIPADWEPNDACWLAWPSHGDLWGDGLPGARAAVTALCAAIDGEQVDLLTLDERGAREAREAMGDRIRTHQVPFGDIWLRDTGPVFAFDHRGALISTVPVFNGWGERYRLEHDDGVALRIAEHLRSPVVPVGLVAEGGAVEVDGAGTLITTRDCLLNPNRNPDLAQEDIEHILKHMYEVDRVVWLRRGLINDHTDGHVDTLARFCAPGVVMCAEPTRDDDPNADALREVIEDLRGARTPGGDALELLTVPSPGTVVARDGTLLPASYLNFYISNGSVVVPTYASDADDRALSVIAAAFPNRRVVAVDCRTLLQGGGTLHCITCQQPRPQGAPS